MPALARVYGIRPGDLDEMLPREIDAFVADLDAIERSVRRHNDSPPSSGRIAP